MSSNISGYRIKVSDIYSFSSFLSSLKSDLLKVLAKNYSKMVAIDVVKKIDLFNVGLYDIDKDIDLFQNSCESIRNIISKYKKYDLDCCIDFFFTKDYILARFISGNSVYRNIFEQKKEVLKWDWNDHQRPTYISEEDWNIRKEYWKCILNKKGIKDGLSFCLIDKSLPNIGWNSIKKHIPPYENRSKFLFNYIKKNDIVLGQDISKKNFLRNIKKNIDRDYIYSYKKEKVLTKNTESIEQIVEINDFSNKVVMIDYADIVKSTDGRIFVATPYAGLDVNSRVYIQVGDNYLSIVQDGVVFGQIMNISKVAVNILKDISNKHYTDAILVEIEISPSRRLLRARHIVIVRDTSLNDSMSNILLSWRNKNISTKQGDELAKEVEQWEKMQEKDMED